MLRIYKGLCRVSGQSARLDCRAMSCSKAQDHNREKDLNTVRKVTHNASKLRNLRRVNEIFPKRVWQNRLSQDMHRQRRMKKRFSIHSSSPGLLQRRISEHPHFKQTTGFFAASIRTLLPAMVGRHNRVSKKGPTGGLVCGEEGVDKRISTNLDIPSKKVNFYLETVNFS